VLRTHTCIHPGRARMPLPRAQDTHLKIEALERKNNQLEVKTTNHKRLLATIGDGIMVLPHGSGLRGWRECGQD